MLRQKLHEAFSNFEAWAKREPPSLQQLFLHNKNILVIEQKIETHNIRGRRIGKPEIRKVCRAGHSSHINFPASILPLLSRPDGDGECVELHIFMTGEREATAIITKPKEPPA